MRIELYLAAWTRQKDDKTIVLKHGYEQFVKDLENLFELKRLRTLDEAAKAVSMLKIKEGESK